jgi:hypothetical protein
MYTPEESEKISQYTEKFVKALKEGNDDEFFKNLGLAVEAHENRPGVVWMIDPVQYKKFERVSHILTKLILNSNGAIHDVEYSDTSAAFIGTTYVFEVRDDDTRELSEAIALSDILSIDATTDGELSICAMVYNVRRELPGRATI